MEVSAYSYTPS